MTRASGIASIADYVGNGADAVITAVKDNNERQFRLTQAVLTEVQRQQRETADLWREFLEDPRDIGAAYRRSVETFTRRQARALEIAREAFQTVTESATEVRDTARQVVQMQRRAGEQATESARQAVSTATQQAAQGGATAAQAVATTIEQATDTAARNAERVAETTARSVNDTAESASSAARRAAQEASRQERESYDASDFQVVYRSEPDNWRAVITSSEQARDRRELAPSVAEQLISDVERLRRRRDPFTSDPNEAFELARSKREQAGAQRNGARSQRSRARSGRASGGGRRRRT